MCVFSKESHFRVEVAWFPNILQELEKKKKSIFYACFVKQAFLVRFHISEMTEEQNC